MRLSSNGEQGGGKASLTLCPIIQHFLPLLALQELRPRLAHAVRHHLVSCQSCMDELKQFEAITLLLRDRSQQDARQDRANTLSSSDPHRNLSRSPGDSFERFPSYGDFIRDAGHRSSRPRSPSSAIPSPESGAMAFARRQNEAFRLAFAEALAGKKHANSFSITTAPLEYSASADDPPGVEELQESGSSEPPSDVFAIGVRRARARIAQQWHDAENQLLKGGQWPC